ncbi:MAG TPA: UDP-2,4-diacetamido-2,4,6-trideoxy-beta-L-altropyranose hydrolase [Sphingorhabdus sp.]|jgi:UDP-2,4-diacetamido-2,4,6-trideoxy-beta-L-altropyranose hydrolase|nr:UDP-2,4-diacetamido-2,4,6-trideoxy-beta-L-altropyranose hydrolase [Sphingorhabdus sp.]
MTGESGNLARILFRVDGDAVIGSGHLRRCLALADRIRDWGYECVFACQASAQSFNGLVRDAGFSLVELVGAHDAEEMVAALAADGPFTALVVDHYRLDAVWELQARAIAQRVLVIDDLSDRQHDCDLLLDAAPGDAARYDALVPPHCRKLLGPRYALLRPEFAVKRREGNERSGAIARILVSFGGVDRDDLTGTAVAAVRAALPDVAIDAVLTSLSPHCDRLKRQAGEDPKLSLHIDANNMAELMASADLAIGAGGSTSWERACLGLPSIVAIIAENQRATARALDDYGGAVSLPVGPEFGAALQQLVAWLSSRPALLRLMSIAGMAVVDGRGVARAAAAIAPPRLMVRPVAADEARKIWEWRNAPEIRATALDPSEIAWDEHNAWFARRMADPQTVMLIGIAQDGEIGFVRFDVAADAAKVSIFLAPGQSGRGLGRALLQAGEQWLVAHYPDIRRFHADVRPENGASIALFRGADYSPNLFSFERTLND